MIYSSINAQTIHFWKIDESKFPTVEVMLTAKNASGEEHYESSKVLTADDFAITENGEMMDIEVDYAPRPDTPAVSILLALDRSSSLSDAPDFNNSLLTWEKLGAHFLIDSLDFKSGSKLAFLSFTNEFNLDHKKRDFTANINKEEWKTHISSMELGQGNTGFYWGAFGKGTVFYKMFAEQTSDEIPRAMVLCTDSYEDEVGLTNDEVDKIIDWALEYKVTFYLITMMESSSPKLGLIADRTGGHKYNPKTENETLRDFGNIVHRMQVKARTFLKWQAPYGCDQASKNRSVNVNVTYKEDNDWDVSYTAPDRSIPSFDLSTTELAFDKPGTGNTERELTVTNHGPAMTIDTLVLDPWGNFVVTNWEGGKNVELADGQSHTFKIDYVEEPSDEIENVTITFVSNDYLCDLPTATISSKWYSVEFDDTHDIDFGSTMTKETYNETITDCVFKNTSSDDITVNVTIEDDSDHEFSITSGGGSRTLAPDECIDDLAIEFAPTEEGTKNAKIRFTVTDPSDFENGDYIVNMTSVVSENSVEEEIIGVSGDNLQLVAEPNPASDQVRIEFNVPRNAYTKLDIYNSVGTHIESLVSKDLGNANYELLYSLNQLPNGFYILRLQSGSKSQTLRFIINK